MSSVSTLRHHPGGQWRMDWKMCPVRRQEAKAETGRSARRQEYPAGRGRSGCDNVTGIESEAVLTDR